MLIAGFLHFIRFLASSLKAPHMGHNQNLEFTVTSASTRLLITIAPPFMSLTYDFSLWLHGVI
jgi:hypothetical protein